MTLQLPSRTVGSQLWRSNRPGYPARPPSPVDLPLRTAVGTGDCSGSGTPVRSEIRPASSRRPRLTSQAGDSGILKNASGNSVTNGSAPIQNRPRQPIESSSRMPRSAASRLPNGTPA